MRILNVEFAGAVAKPGGPVPGALPQVAFAGRSNVGKSSLINRLLGRTRTAIARVSSEPGKTREINFYRVDYEDALGARAEFFLVDLPGYGFAKVPIAVRDAWRPLIERYMEGTSELRGVVQLIDARHDPTKDDRRMVEYLATLELPVLVVATKMDRVGSSKRNETTRSIARQLGVDMDQVLPFSAKTGDGRDELVHGLGALLAEQKHEAAREQES
jgi:GTP-binding protein